MWFFLERRVCVENLDAVFFIEMATLWSLLQLYSSQSLTTYITLDTQCGQFCGYPTNYTITIA